MKLGMRSMLLKTPLYFDMMMCTFSSI